MAEQSIHIPPGLPATEAQRAYVDGLRKRLSLSKPLLDNHCIARFGCPLAELDRAALSALIEELKEWQTIPNQLLRESGQRDLPGFGEL